MGKVRQDNPSAETLFPDLFMQETAPPKKAIGLKSPHRPVKKFRNRRPLTGKSGPPRPPDISWLYDNSHQEPENAETKLAPALITGLEYRDEFDICTHVQKLNYTPEIILETTDALIALQNFNYGMVINFSSLINDAFHERLIEIGGEKRRSMFYILIGSGYSTLYNLEALAHSANLVINTSDMMDFDKILDKSLQDYQKIFGPIIELLGTRTKTS